MFNGEGLTEDDIGAYHPPGRSATTSAIRAHRKLNCRVVHNSQAKVSQL